jgi:excisionase family DNA binding protein
VEPTVDTAAERLKVNRRTLIRWLNEDKYPKLGYRIGKRWRIDPEILESISHSKGRVILLHPVAQPTGQYSTWTEEAQLSCPTGGPNPQGFATIWSVEAVGAKWQADPATRKLDAPTYGRALFDLTAQWCKDHALWLGAITDIVCYAREVVLYGEPGPDRDIASGFLLEASHRLMGSDK